MERSRGEKNSEAQRKRGGRREERKGLARAEQLPSLPSLPRPRDKEGASNVGISLGGHSRTAAQP